MEENWTALYLPSTSGIDHSKSGFKTIDKAWKYTERFYCKGCRNLIARALKAKHNGTWISCDEFVDKEILLIQNYNNKNQSEKNETDWILQDKYSLIYGDFGPGCDAEWDVLKTSELFYKKDSFMLKENIKNNIKNNITKAVKDKDVIRRDLLKVALGEIQTLESRKGSITEEEAQKVLRKLIISNQETINLLDDEIKISVLKNEINILEEFLPQLMKKDEIYTYIAVATELMDNIRNASNDGQAIGIAIKALKSDNKIFDGKVVAEIVKEIRINEMAKAIVDGI